MTSDLPIPQIHTSDLYTLMGRSLCAVQVLEHMLAYYLGLWAQLPPNESRELVETSTPWALKSPPRPFPVTPTWSPPHEPPLRNRRIVPIRCWPTPRFLMCGG